MRKQWVPTDTALGELTSAQVREALAPLAAHARTLRWVNLGAIAMLTMVTIAAIIWVASAGKLTAAWIWLPMAAAALISLRASRTNLIWDGKANWLTAGARPVPTPDLPADAAKLLAELQAGRCSMRRQSGPDRDWVPLAANRFRGPFGALMLSPDIEVQGLTPWTWREDYGLAFAVEVDDGRKPGWLPDWADPCLGLPPARLAAALAKTLVDIDSDDAKVLKYDAMMIASELLNRGIGREAVKALIDATCRCLKVASGQPVTLSRAAPGWNADEQLILTYRKRRAEPYTDQLGLRGTTSASWMEKAFCGRYVGFSEVLIVKAGLSET